jgi:sec-independent protein translocase protein TatA
MSIDKWMILALVLVVIIMGPTQLPKLAKMFGSGVKSLRDGMEGVEDEDEDAKPKKKKPAPEPDDDAEDEAPKPKKKAKPADDEDE